MVPTDTFMDGVRDHTDRIDRQAVQLESQARETGLEILVVESVAEQHLVEASNGLEGGSMHQKLTEAPIGSTAETTDPGIEAVQQLRIELIRPAVGIQLQ